MMPNQFLRWGQVSVKDVYGSDCASDWPAIIDLYYQGRLLGCILAMETKRRISMAEAIRLLNDKCLDELNRKTKKEEWYLVNFVAWISSLGYQIEITGDEFSTTATYLDA